MEAEKEQEMIELEVGSDLRRRPAAHHAEEGDSNADGGFDSKVLSVEQIFEGKVVPSWKDQMTFRAFVVSLVLGFFFSFIDLTTGIVPSLNVSAGLLGFFLVKTWMKTVDRFPLLGSKQPFALQENTVIQTCVVAFSGIAFSGLVTIQNTLLYNTTGANYKCSIGHSSCAFQLPFLRENAAVLTTSGPEQVYLTIFNLLIFKIFTNFLVCSGNYVEQQKAAVSEGRSPLLNKEDHHLSLGSSYDSVSNDEEDVEEQLDVSTKLVNEAEADNTRCLCAVCCDVQRDSFFLPCGHCTTCFTCGARIADEVGTCSICRRKMKKMRTNFTV